jgi:hypothetical protein
MKGRKHKAAGGEAEHGDREYEKDLATKNQRYTYQSHVNEEAEEKKRGGRAKRKHGGHVKHAGKVHGHAKHHAGRKPRKAGGRASGADQMPLSSAHKGMHPAAHHDVELD